MAASNSHPQSLQSNCVHEGYLVKRQRGRKQNANLKRLIFQRRYCVLSENGLKYFSSKSKYSQGAGPNGDFPVKNITIVEKVPTMTFSKQYCFQIGNGNEMMYFMADSADERDEWISKFREAARLNRNKMLPEYHIGVFGQCIIHEWSCCDGLKESQGCQKSTSINASSRRTSCHDLTVSHDREQTISHCDDQTSQEQESNPNGAFTTAEIATQTDPLLWSRVPPVVEHAGSSLTPNSPFQFEAVPPSPISAASPPAPSNQTPAHFIYKSRQSIKPNDQKCSIVVYGIEECPKGTPKCQRATNDSKAVFDIINMLDASISEDSLCDCWRIGKYRDSHTRPIHAKLSRSREVISILSNRHKLAGSKGIFIKHLMTPEQKLIKSILLRKRHELISSGIDRKSIRIRGNCIYIKSDKLGSIVDFQFVPCDGHGLPDERSAKNWEIDDSSSQIPSNSQSYLTTNSFVSLSFH